MVTSSSAPPQSSSLKTALLDYLKRCRPGDSEKHNMVALCFSMRREIGENHEMAARTQLKLIESQEWGEAEATTGLEAGLGASVEAGLEANEVRVTVVTQTLRPPQR